MDLSTIIGLAVGFGSLIVSVLMEGGSPLAFVQMSAMLIVFGGTIGATLIAFPMENVTKLPTLFQLAIKQQKHNAYELIELFSSLAEKARKNGLLSLESETKDIDDPFLKQSIMMAVDGIDAEVLKEILEVQVENLTERHEVLFGMLEAMGGFAPTMGIIGTVMGLVHVLSNLSDPNSLGPEIAVAFIATLWGVSIANLLWLPLGSKLKRKSHEEAFYRNLIIEGVLAVQSGENPRLVRQKLEGMVGKEKKKDVTKPDSGGQAEKSAA
ncbi:MAG TPA: flagellar motor protein [Ktedonobacterales bacterium]|nr:flagellar motor protein [Ktedonobacterales bacterium]